MTLDSGPGAPAGTDDAVTALRRAAGARLEAGDIAGAESSFEDLVALAAREGRADADAWVHLLRARLAAAREDTDAASSLAARACAAFLGLGPTAAAALGLAALARLLDELRRFDEAVEALAIAAFFADQLTESSPVLVEACCELAAVFGELEAFEVAYRHAERAYVVTLPSGDHRATIDRCVALAQLAGGFADELSRAGDETSVVFAERARQAAQLGLDLVARHDGSVGQRRALQLALGRALVAATPGDAEAVLTAVLADAAAADHATIAAARAGLGHARLLAGDPIGAIEHLTVATAACTEGGRALDGLRVGASTALAEAQAMVGRTNAAFASLQGVVEAERAAHRHRRRRVAEVVDDRMRVVTDDHALVRRGRAFSTDPVTGLADRTHVEGAIDELGKRWAGHDVALVLLRIVDLAPLRTRFDAHTTDAVLREIATVLRARQRGDDVVARWDDETFCVLLPRCPSAAADQVAARLSEAVASVPWSELAEGLAVAATAGTACAPAPVDLAALVGAASAELASSA